MKGKISCVYGIISISNGCYIGSTGNYHRRIRDHKLMMAKGNHHSDAINSAVNKYGIGGFSFEIIEECEIESLIEREQWWIENYKTRFRKLYNMSKIAGRVEHTEEVRLKISEGNKGKSRNDETRRKISIRAKLASMNENWHLRNSPGMTGKSHTRETKKLIGLSKIGKPRDEETKRKISETIRQKNAIAPVPKKSEATRARMREAALLREARKREARNPTPAARNPLG